MEIKRSGIIKSNVVFNRERTHRYVLTRVWSEDVKKEMGSVILFNPSYADELLYDYTSMKIINYLIKNTKYKGVHILNLYSIIEQEKNNVKNDKKKLNLNENNKWINKCIKESKKIYKGWGSNKDNKNRILEIRKILKRNNFEGIYELIDKDGQGKHPSRCTIDGEMYIELQNLN